MRDISGPVHFVGIGGIHMSALAHILLDDGVTVSGCDREDGPTLSALRKRGVEIAIGHDPSHVSDADLARVIRTVAVPVEHPEIAAASERGLPIATRAELLAEVAAPRDVIAVGGSHGKSTTTAMIAHAMRASGRDTGYVLGGETASLVPHARRGTDPWLVLEADEYGRAFHHYTPQIAIATNVDADHLDYYGDEASLREAFYQYVSTTRPGGALIVGAHSPQARALAARVERERPDLAIVRFGAGCEWNPRVRSESAQATGYTVATPHGEISGELRSPGRYQLLNVAAALSALEAAGFDVTAAAESLASFPGVARRFQLHGERRGVTVLDDYAHHPTEIAATVAAVKSRYAGRRVVVLFQPHTYTRSSYLLDGFRDCFEGVDRLWLASTYAARETPDQGLTAEQLAAQIDHRSVQFGGDVAETARRAVSEADAGDVMITMGAGNIDAAGPIILRELESAQ